MYITTAKVLNLLLVCSHQRFVLPKYFSLNSDENRKQTTPIKFTISTFYAHLLLNNSGIQIIDLLIYCDLPNDSLQNKNPVTILKPNDQQGRTNEIFFNDNTAALRGM